MRTIHRIPAAAVRGLILFLLLSLYVVFCVPRAQTETRPDLPTASPTPFYTAFGAAQQSSPTTQTEPVSVVARLDSFSISPETLGDLMMIHQRYLAAIQAYQRAPRTSVLWNKLGIAYQHMYALDIAKLQYEKALTLNPKYPEALNNLGTVFYGEHSYRKAEKYYRRALKLKPKCATFYSNLGTAYFADHNFKRGIQAYRKAFALDPEVFIGNPLDRVSETGPADEEVTLNYALARLYAQAGMVGPAIHYLRMAFMDGFNDNHKLLHDSSFAAIRNTPQFRLFMTEEHVKDGNTEESMMVPASQ